MTHHTSGYHHNGLKVIKKSDLGAKEITRGRLTKADFEFTTQTYSKWTT